MLFIPFILVILFILLLKTLVVIDQYERGIVLTLGSYSYTLQPGLKILIPIVQRIIKVDIRITTSDIPQQEVITKDNVPVGINAVVYFQVSKPEAAVLKIQDFTYAVTQYAQTALRDVIGQVELDSLLTDRQKIADEIKKIVDSETTEWGVDVTAIKIQDIELPADMKRAMAKQAEAERERRATIIRSQGELSASANLKKAMDHMSSSGAISLRTLQTIEATTANPASTIIFAVPIEIIEGLKKLGGK
ncbi:MAG: mechanosensory protein 2 [Candidatus Gottesmanbacteria bacterium GW2011_GWA2_43_14]|uniref:Mechanosensory protein 2 n=1 Tax=Candidatus Gottesmanbacteria bacterium GW2011_GWA2_43_14 TaxID=1618443 RepID=A0A0G1DDH6_9BACT|nr:MAG: mechanosensory protein 2 [Candidatus Gottesmanbacteria bacterium GW2011_GWA2_43_14]